MGVDISSHSGFTLPYDEFLRLIKPAHVRSIKVHAVQLFLRRMAVDFSRGAYTRISSTVELYDEIEKALGQILGANDPVEMTRALTDPMKDGRDWIFEHSDQAVCLIQCICRVLLPIEPEEIRVFRNPREEDCYGQRLNFPILVFPSSQCFKVVMTRMGRTMAQTIGKSEIEISEWTTYSY